MAIAGLHPPAGIWVAREMPEKSQGRSRVLAFLDWWGRELSGLVPAACPVARNARRKWLVVSLDHDTVRVTLENGRQVRDLADWPNDPALHEEIATAVEALARRHRCGLGLRVAYDACFSRLVELPAAASADIPGILRLDLERSTPFSTSAVLSTHRRIGGDAGPTISVEHLILKRDRVEPLMGLLARRKLEIDRIDCAAPEAGGRALPVDFLFDFAAHAEAGHRSRRNWQYAAMVAGILLAGTAVVHATRLQTAVAEVEGRVAALKEEVAVLRRRREEADARQRRRDAVVALKRAEVSRAGLIDTLTQLLPDTDHLRELRFDGDSVDLSGVSAVTAELIARIERSDAFSDVKLTAPVTRDRETGKERFSLNARTARLPLLSRKDEPGSDG